MEKEIIEKYIKFAIDNILEIENKKILSVRFDEYHWIPFISLEVNHKMWVWKSYKMFNLIELITKKEFIEAIARWKWKKILERTKDSWINASENLDDSIQTKIMIIREITIEQTIAIRDWKLEEFILSIIK